MFPWVKIKKVTPSPTTTSSQPTTTTTTITVAETPTTASSSASSAPLRTTIEVSTDHKRSFKNLRRALNRRRKREEAQLRGEAPILKTAARLASRSRCQQRRADRKFKRALLEAKVASTEAADVKDLVLPDFKDSASSFEHRSENEFRQESRRLMELARIETARALRLKEASKAAKKRDTNPIDPFFNKNIIDKQKHAFLK